MGYHKRGTETGYNTQSYGQIYAGNIVTWAHPKKSNSGAEWSEWRDREVTEAEIQLCWTRLSIPGQQLDPQCSR